MHDVYSHTLVDVIIKLADSHTNQVWAVDNDEEREGKGSDIFYNELKHKAIKQRWTEKSCTKNNLQNDRNR